MKLTEEILWDLIDDNLSSSEAEEVTKLIQQSPEWLDIYQTQLDLHSTLQKGIKRESPSIHFSDKVMDSIYHFKTARARKGAGISKINLKGLLLTIGGIIIGAVILSQGILDFSLLDYSTLSADQLRTPYLDASPVLEVLGSDMLVKAFLFVDAILAIFLVERFLFRPMARG